MAARFFDPAEGDDLQRAQMQRAAYEQWKAMATQRDSDNVAALASTYPHMRPGSVLSLAKAGVAPETPVAKAAAKAEAKRGFGFHSIGDAITGAAAATAHGVGAVKDVVYGGMKGISRGLDIGISSVGQTFQGAMRGSVADNDISGAEWLLGLPHLASGFKQTSLYSALEGKDTGSGFFAGGEAERAAVARRRTAAPLIDGHAVTIGRYAAKQVFEPGHRPYSILSGLIDTGMALGSDPTIVASGPIKAVTGGSRLLAGGKAGERAVTAMSVTETAAKRKARAFGDGQATAREFSQDAMRHGSANPAVERIERSRREGLLSATEADNALALHQGNIAVAGGLDQTPRKTVFKTRVAEWLDSTEGRRVRTYLANETNFERMRQVTKGKLDSETLVRLTDARSDADVLDILGPKLGVEVREKFGASRAAVAAAQGGDGFLARRVGGKHTRLGAQMPGSHLDLENVDTAVEEIARWGTNAKMADDRIGHWTERMARADGVNGRFAVTREMLDEVRDDIIARSGSKVSASQKQALTRMYADYEKDLRVYAIDAVGRNAKVPGAIINGDGEALPTAHAFVEYIHGSVPMPDAREMRRATSRYVKLLDDAELRGRSLHLRSGYNGMNAVADFLTQQAFKPLVLLRGAWTVRVVGEEQVRLAASGMTSMFAHPLSHIAMALGKKGNLDLKGELLDHADELQEALSRGGREWRGQPNAIKSGHRIVLDRDDPNHAPRFAAALADEIGKLARDPIMRRVLNGLGEGDLHPTEGLTGLDAVKDWFFYGTGRRFRDEIRAADKAGDRAWLDTKVAADGNSADGYIDSLLERAKTIAGGDARLLDAIATGHIDDLPISVASAAGARVPNREAVKALQRLLDEGIGPQHVPGDVLVHVKNNAGSQVLDMYDRAVETMFNTLMSRPTNFLSRSPAFKQYYWQRNAELVPYMTRETQEQALRVARESGLRSDVIKQIEKGIELGSGRLNVADADLVAKGFALDSTRKLLYDLSDRSQFFDITRAIFPFGEAWKEVATTWARIGVQNPTMIRRGQIVVTGLRSADTNGDGQGFFHTDQQTGEEVFNYPFTGWLSKKLTGVPAPLKAPAQGLNLFSTSVLPGVGPVVQIPVGKLIPDRPEWDPYRELVLPFGDKDTTGGVVESFLPAWLQKFRAAGLVPGFHASPAQQRLYANTVMDVMRYLSSTGDYPLDSAEAQDRLLREAQSRADKIYALRGAAQFFVPSPPSPEFFVKDKDGNGLLAIKLVEEYRKLQDEDYTTATEKFIDRFGEGAFLTTVSKTGGGGTPTDEMYDFVREHPDIPRKYADVYGYFLPTGGEFSQKAYNYQLRSGQRTPIKPEEALEIVNQRLGSMVYRQAKEKVGDHPSKSQRVWLSEVRDLIEQQYPGFNPTPANLREQKLLITKMVAAVDNPVLARTDAGQGLTEYLEARNEAYDIARRRGLTQFQVAKSARDIRAGLRELADEITERHPDFGELFERTFNREMVSDEEAA